MKKFIYRLALFCIPLFLGLIWLFLYPVDRAWAYHYLENNCANHGVWLHDRIFENSKPVDVAFIGSSRMIHSVMDEKLDQALYDRYIANLSYCWLGRNLTYTLLKDLLKTKQPQMLVLEVREDEDRYSHKIFPYLAEPEDVLLPPLWFNRDVFRDFYLALETRIQYARHQLLGLTEAYPVNLNPYGYGSSDLIADHASLEINKQERILRAQNAVQGWQRDFYMKYPRAYLEKIAQLARKHQIKLAFLYLPEYGWPLEKPLELSTYEQYGEVWLPPRSVFENPGHWMDDGHLNDKGALELTRWVIEKLK